jgi:hypothetical protein
MKEKRGDAEVLLVSNKQELWAHLQSVEWNTDETKLEIILGQTLGSHARILQWVALFHQINGKLIYVNIKYFNITILND